MVFWTLRLCIPLLLSWNFGVRPCMHTATSSWTFGSHPHSHSVEHLLEHLHPLLFSLFCLSCFVTLGCFVNSLCLPAVGYALVSWVLGSQPLAVCYWVLGSQHLGCFTFFTAIWRVFHSTKPMIPMPTSPSESLLLFNPWNQLNCFTSRASRTHKPLVTIEVAIFTHNSVGVQSLLHLLSRELHHIVSTTLSTSCPFLHGSDFSRLFLHTTIVCVSRQDTLIGAFCATQWALPVYS